MAINEKKVNDIHWPFGQLKDHAQLRLFGNQPSYSYGKDIILTLNEMEHIHGIHRYRLGMNNNNIIILHANEHNVILASALAHVPCSVMREEDHACM